MKNLYQNLLKGDFMRLRVICLVGIFTSFLYGQSYPMKDIFESLDVTSFNSSIRPKINGVDKEIKLSKLNFLKEGEEDGEIYPASKVEITNDTITIEDEFWFYKIKAMKKNGDDYHICFTDKAKQGTYDAQYPLVLRKYGDLYVVINVYSDVCKKWAR